MNCGNCGTKLSCGCQRAAAKDGKSCCTSCVAVYNATLPASISPKTIARPKSAFEAAPTNVSVVYRGPGQQH